jgi:hypothetical protein
MRQNGISPKLLADFVVSAISFVALYFGVDLDPEVAAALAKVVGFIAGYVTGPGNVQPT